MYPTLLPRTRVSLFAFFVLLTLGIQPGCTNDPSPPSDTTADFPDYAGRWKIAQSDVPDNMLALLTALRASTGSIAEKYDGSLIEYEVEVTNDNVVVERIEDEEGTSATGGILDSMRTIDLRGDTLYITTSKYWMKLVRDPEPASSKAVGKQGEDWRIISSSREGLRSGSVFRNGIPLLRFGSDEYIVELIPINDSQVVGSGATTSAGVDYDWEGIVSNVTVTYNGNTAQVTLSNGQCVFGRDYPSDTPVTFTAEKM